MPCDFPYSSAYPGWKLDPIPQGLKPTIVEHPDGTTEAVPLQSFINSQKPPRRADILSVSNKKEHRI